MSKNLSQSSDLHVLCPPAYEYVTVGCVCIHVRAGGWRHILLVPEQGDKFYSFIMGHCLVSMNISAPKKGTLQLDPKTCYGNFLNYGCNNFC
jgi:hypothetical protein